MHNQCFFYIATYAIATNLLIYNIILLINLTVAHINLIKDK